MQTRAIKSLQVIPIKSLGTFSNMEDWFCVPELWTLIWLTICQAGGKIWFRFFHGSASDLTQWTDELAETTINDG